MGNRHTEASARFLAKAAMALFLAGMVFSAQAEDAKMVKLGEIEAQTGPSATYGWMSAQGARLAVHEINEAGGFKVGDSTYKFDLTQLDTRGEPREGIVQFKQLRSSGVNFILGPFLSNIYSAVAPLAIKDKGDFLLFSGATSAHKDVGKPDHKFLIRTFNWDGGESGFGRVVVDELKNRGVKKVAILLPNDAFSNTALSIYQGIFDEAGIATVTELYAPGTNDFTAVLRKLASTGATYLFTGFDDSILLNIVRQATGNNDFTRFVTVRGSIGPALANKDAIDDYLSYIPKYFSPDVESTPRVQKFISEYEKYYKGKFPYDQGPLCASSCYDVVYMIKDAMVKAGTVSDVNKIREVILRDGYDGLWNTRFDSNGEAVFDFDLVSVGRGGKISVKTVKPK